VSQRIFTDQQLRDYSEEHLLYELHIFRWLAENLPPDKGFQLSALLESFAIHLRNLIEFFYTQPQDARNDGVIAADFFDPPSAWNLGLMPKSVNDARERANKEISHITYRRKGATDPTKPWPVGSLFREVHAIAQKFAAGASRDRLHPRVVNWLKSDTKAMTVLLGSASTTTSNVAVAVTAGVASSSQQLDRALALLQTETESGRLGAAAILVVRNSRVILHEGFGCTSAAPGGPAVQPDSVFLTASIRSR
jgi:hypothetical protein